MRTFILLIAGTTMFLGGLVLGQEKPAATQPINWAEARQAYDKEKNGQPLTDDERALLARAKANFSGANANTSRPAVSSTGVSGPVRTGAASRPADNDVTLPVVIGNSGPTTEQAEKTGLVPLCDMTARDTYKNQDGGLYGHGQNDPPPEQLKAAKAALAQITPLDANGQSSPEGKIVLMSVGMSNTMNEFGCFARDFAGKNKSPAVVVVNEAQGGQTVSEWAKPESPVWKKAETERLKPAGVTPAQVQVIWLKQAIGGPFRFGEFPRHAKAMEEFLIRDINLIAQHYPNLRIIYLSSRIYGGNARINLQPEPYAYEEGFAVRWVIHDQIKGEPRLNFDPSKGKVQAPVLLWGPYLWADGTNPRQSDGLSYAPKDFAEDGIHPAPPAQQKVAALLQTFFTNDLNAAWYVKGGAVTPGTK